MVLKKFNNGVPFPEEIREMNPKEPLDGVLKEFRKNGIQILSVQETPLKRFPLYPYTKWYDITFMAFSSEN